MTFIIMCIALAIERFFDWSHIRQWRMFTSWQKWLSMRLSPMPSWLVLALCVLPWVLAIGLINCLLSGVLFGVLKLVFGVVILVYCLGPVNFWAEAYTCISGLQGEDTTASFEKVKKAFGVTVFTNPQEFHRAFTNALFVEANRRNFAIFFWFVLLGPAGAVLYRQVDLCRTRGITQAAVAGDAQAILDWLPVRVFTFMFALGGHFTKVIKHWKHDFFAAPKLNETIMSECGVASLDVLEAERIPEDGTAENETIALIDRVFLIGLVILAFAVLTRFL